MVLFPGQYMTGDAFRLEGAEADSRHGADGDGALHADDDANALFDEQQAVGGEVVGGDTVQLFFGNAQPFGNFLNDDGTAGDDDGQPLNVLGGNG